MVKRKKPRRVRQLGAEVASRRKRRRRGREAQQLRWIQIGVSALVVVVGIIVAVGLISHNSRAAAMVNDQAIRVPEYQRRLRFQYHLYNGYLAPGYFERLEPEQQTQFYTGVVEQLIGEALILGEAQKRGLYVTDEEVQIEMEETWFQHYRVPPTPTPSPTAHPGATPTQEGTPLPTPTPDTEEAFRARYEEFVESVLKPARLDEAYFREVIRASLLRERLEMAMVPDLPDEEEQVNLRYAPAQDAQDGTDKIARSREGVPEQVRARHILVETQEEAEAVLMRLEGGEGFEALAAELSMDESNKNDGGDLGWFGRGQMVPEFERVAFEAGVGLHAFPVETEFGYHVIEVLGYKSLTESMVDLGWYGRQQLIDRFGPLFAEIVFTADIGLLPDPVPTEFGVAVVEVVGREVRAFDEIEQARLRTDLFQKRLDEIREEGDIQDLWEADMVPRRM